LFSLGEGVDDESGRAEGVGVVSVDGGAGVGIKSVSDGVGGEGVSEDIECVGIGNGSVGVGICAEGVGVKGVSVSDGVGVEGVSDGVSVESVGEDSDGGTGDWACGRRGGGNGVRARGETFCFFICVSLCRTPVPEFTLSSEDCFLSVGDGLSTAASLSSAAVSIVSVGESVGVMFIHGENVGVLLTIIGF
jgi:hypothetical protein